MVAMFRHGVLHKKLVKLGSNERIFIIFYIKLTYYINYIRLWSVQPSTYLEHTIYSLFEVLIYENFVTLRGKFLGEAKAMNFVYE